MLTHCILLLSVPVSMIGPYCWPLLGVPTSTSSPAAWGPAHPSQPGRAHPSTPSSAAICCSCCCCCSPRQKHVDTHHTQHNTTHAALPNRTTACVSARSLRQPPLLTNTRPPLPLVAPWAGALRAQESEGNLTAHTSRPPPLPPKPLSLPPTPLHPSSPSGCVSVCCSPSQAGTPGDQSGPQPPGTQCAAHPQHTSLSAVCRHQTPTLPQPWPGGRPATALTAVGGQQKSVEAEVCTGGSMQHNRVAVHAAGKEIPVN